MRTGRYRRAAGRSRGDTIGAKVSRIGRIARVLVAAAAVAGAAQSSRAQTPSGSVMVSSDFFPNRGNTGELRTRVFAEEVLEPAPGLVMRLSGFAEGLLARRPVGPSGPDRTVRAAVARVVDGHIDYRRSRIDLLAGFTRIAWGRLDELQPTDVINPLDVSRFFFESRSEARLPVAVVRLRGYLTETASLEAVYVPFFRRGRFDQLEEPSSPFNIESSVSPDLAVCLAIGCPTVLPIRVEEREPPRTFASGQGGLRLNATAGRVDWSLSAYRGFEPFGLGVAGPQLSPSGSELPVNVEHPRFTMLGGDFETVRGQWGIRGELAAFVEDNFQGASLRRVAGRSFDAGIGVDRKAGDYRISGTALVHRETYDEPLSPGGEGGRADLSLILSADRSFARERYGLRTFGVYNANESSAFLRAIVSAKVRDNVALEGSGGWFVGSGRDLVGRFGDSDFVYARLKYFF